MRNDEGQHDQRSQPANAAKLAVSQAGTIDRGKGQAMNLPLLIADRF